MLIFAKLLQDSSILNAVEDFKSVILIGCPVCANFSLSYEKNMPSYRRVKDNATGEIEYEPEAITFEADRLKSLFEEKGMNVKT